MSSTLTEELGSQDLLAVSSSTFGIYEVPRIHIEGMTSQKIIDHIAKIASAGQTNTSSAMAVHLDPQLSEMLHMLHCGEQLRADLPALLHHHVASLIVKCWMYLVWTRLIEIDEAAVGLAIRDQVLWSLMRPFESAHHTQAALSHRDNRHAKGKVKQGMKLVSLLLCNYALLQKFVTLGNISTNALVTLPQEQMSVGTLRTLVEKLEGAGHTVSKNNIQALLVPQQASSSDASSPHASVTSAASAAHELTMLSRPSPLPSTDNVRRSGRRALVPPPDQGDVIASSNRADVDMDADTNKSIAEPKKRTEGHQRARRGSETIIQEEEEEQVSDAGDADQEEESPSSEESQSFDEPTSKRSGSKVVSAQQRAVHQRRLVKRRRTSRERVPPAPAVSGRSNARLPVEVEEVPLHQQTATNTHFVQRLGMVTFRAPDDIRGCVQDDQEHDLFCRHHLQWRQGALLELAQLSPSALQLQVAAAQSKYANASAREMYLELVRRWGQRVQFVAPLQMDSQETLQQALAHLSLELHSHDTDCLFYSHSFLLEQSDGLHWLPACSPDQDICFPSRRQQQQQSPSYNFLDPETTLRAVDARKYWVFREI